MCVCVCVNKNGKRMPFAPLHVIFTVKINAAIRA